jgi:predicted small metal-binding protein
MALEFRCADVGVVCKAAVRAETAEDLVAKIADHVDKVHGVPQLTQTLVNYAKTKVRVVGDTRKS